MGCHCGLRKQDSVDGTDRRAREEAFGGGKEIRKNCRHMGMKERGYLRKEIAGGRRSVGNEGEYFGNQSLLDAGVL